MAVTADGKQILAGCEPFSAPGGPLGVLLLHGFTGSPDSLGALAHGFAAEGFAVELPLLPGHGTSVDDLAATGWDDWSTAAEGGFADLAGRVERVVVVGLSMGGSLAAWLATRHPEIAGVVCINPALEIAQPIVDAAREMIASGTDRVPSIGGDVADPEMREKAYDATPLRPLLSFAEALGRLRADLDRVACPVLIMTSTQDHVVDPGDSDILARSVAGPVERVVLERSYHVATLDHDRDLIVERSLAFAREVTAGAAPRDR